MYHIISNKVYLGKITHKNKEYDGLHEPIISEELFNDIQNLLKANSPEMDNFIRNNYRDLKSGKEVAGSLRFNGFTNLHNAFGSVDVLSAKAQGNYVDVVVLDTYDFNKNDPNPLVKMGRRAQETGKLNPYFTIVKCRYKLK